MPVFIDPNQPPLPVPEHSASSDGILNAWVLNSEGACTPYCATYCDRHNRTEGNEFVAPGVYLEADFSSRGYGNLVPDPGFVDPDRNAIRFPPEMTVSDGYATIPDPSDSWRVWIVGDRIAAASSSSPLAPAPDNGAWPVNTGDVLNLAIRVSASVSDREVRFQVTKYKADGSTLGLTYPAPNTVVPGPDQELDFRTAYTIPDDGTAYVAVAFVTESTFGGTVTIREPSVSFASYDLNPLIGVRFYRINADGTKVAVRGADFAYAVGGKALAYDQEAPLGQASQWIACPVFYDGTEGECSKAVAVTVPWPEGCMDTWIKPVSDPDLTMVVQMIEPWPEFTRAARNNLSEIQSSTYRAGSWDLRLSWEATFTFYTPDRYERQRIIDALSVGPILLQSNPEYLIPEEFCLPGDLQEVYTNTQTMTDPGRTWTVTLTTVARPATQDSPSAIPGRTYRDTNAKAGTYRMREQVFPLYIDATRPMGVAMTEIAEATQP